jgi:hypothetical protein
MTATSPIAWTSTRPAKAPNATGARRREGRMRLLKALRGPGVLIWSDGWVPVTYELDVFQLGSACVASGALQGDLDKLAALFQLDVACGTRLRTADGWEIDVDLIGLEGDAASFDVTSALDESALRRVG